MRIFRQTRFAIIFYNTICYLLSFVYTYKYRYGERVAFKSVFLLPVRKACRVLCGTNGHIRRFGNRSSINVTLQDSVAPISSDFPLLQDIFYRSLPTRSSSLIAGLIFTVA